VLKTSLAGALVDIGLEKPAFLHISRIPSADKQAKNVEDLLKVGQEIDVWVKRVTRDRVELTMFQPLEYEWSDLKSDMIVKGKVVKLEKFGAFVEIGAERPGLVHVSEISREYVKTPADKLKEGDEVEAQVLDVDRRKKQIKLSIKALEVAREKDAEASVNSKQSSRRNKKRNH